MNFTKRGNLKKANEMSIRATGFSNAQKHGQFFTLSANGADNSFYIQFTPAEARQIIDSWQRMFEDHKNEIAIPS